MRYCFDPQSAVCQGCILTENPDEVVMFHLTHLEKDHGIVIKEEYGIVKMDYDEYMAKRGHHHSV